MNRLANATSPYLRQHADNPVDWFEWGEEAFVEARRRNVPIFLSVGYATCHWCHVMAHESFEDDATAAVLNAQFVCVKVDREERPDVDAVYMAALQAFSGHGGWPMSMFLDHDLAPFYAGTYWPKTPRHGAPTFLSVLDAIHDAWVNRQDDITETVTAIRDALANDTTDDDGTAATFDVSVADAAADLLATRAYDREHGGFGRAPKFPYAMTLEWLLYASTRRSRDLGMTATLHTLEAMARGGIFDLVDDGIARYATDDRWLVPHFEKMLYDNALLLPVYAAAYVHTGRDVFLRTAESIARWLARMQHENGGFFSAVDADSDGEEGAFAVFSHTEFVDVVTHAGEDADLFATFFGVTPHGNFDGNNVLSEPVDRDLFAKQHGLDEDTFRDRLAAVCDALRHARSLRPQPIVDDKILTDLNSLAIVGLIRAGQALDRPDWIETARHAATFLATTHRDGTTLTHVSKDGVTGVDGFASDYATFALAALEMFARDGDATWLGFARDAAETLHAKFLDEQNGGYFTTATDAETLLIRPKDVWDNATPAATSVAIEVCFLLAEITGDGVWQTRGETALTAFMSRVEKNPAGYGWMLKQVEALTRGPKTCVIVGDAGDVRDALKKTAYQHQAPGLFVVVTDTPDQAIPLFVGRHNTGTPVAYVCRGTVCERPVTTPEELAALLA